MTTERVKVRGLVRVSSAIFGVWGVPVVLKGIFDLVAGEPEANLYAPKPWAFVTRPEWLRYSIFELVYGLACAVLAFLLWTYAAKLPEFIERPASPKDSLFS
jgi:hypothetical protein